MSEGTIFNQIVRYELWSSVWLVAIPLGIALLFFLLSFMVLRTAIKDGDKDKYDKPAEGAVFAGLLFLGFMFVVLVFQLPDIIKCITAPQLVVQEHERSGK